MPEIKCTDLINCYAYFKLTRKTIVLTQTHKTHKMWHQKCAKFCDAFCVVACAQCILIPN